jgi:catechol 2,3-dioxygenase-like lactoylglutathione lyase family enzyme
MKIAGIHHATFLTRDLTKARDFYERVLQLQPASDRPQMSFDGVWYELAPNQQIHLMLRPDAEVGSVRPAHGGRDRHVALCVNDLAQLQARLSAAHVAFTLSQSGRAALFCRDPDQNALEFVQLAT